MLNVQNARNHWDAFKILKTSLGETTYTETIRKCLRPAQTQSIPSLYGHIWRLSPQGIINLNLDRFASRAFAEAFSGTRSISEFNSKSVGDHTHVLVHPTNFFIYNAHGIDDDVSSWVFTKEELAHLTSRREYVNFISTVLSSFTVLFVGISAEDQAAGGHLKALKDAGISVGSHYWITDRFDPATDSWAERNHVRIIRYESEGDNHQGLEDLFNDLLEFRPNDEPIQANPIRPLQEFDPQDDLPPADDFTRYEPEMARIFLNTHAQRLLSDDSDEAYKKYAMFTDEYDLAIHHAWYVGKPPKNVVLNYEVLHQEAQGAFGKVYKARDSKGNEVAVKILLQEIRGNREALSCFRRGVSSMRILKQRGVAGMVEYLEAYEIPAMVVMEWVNGADLRKAIASRDLDDWLDLLKVATELSTILLEAHKLPERVLHRDLRPANIMLEGFHQTPDWHVKVLDFDLSWHRGANDRTVVHQAGTTGYLAPEQIQVIPGVSTRHSSVDSFGLGMTMFFMVSGHDPLPDQHKHRDWEDCVLDAANARRSAQWKTLPERITRLIIAATQDEQVRRPDMTAMNFEIRRLATVTSGKPVSEGCLDLVAEEIAFRSDKFLAYQWNTDESTATVDRPSGLHLNLRANESKERVTFTYKQSAVSRKGVNRRVAQAIQEARAHLKQEGWQVLEHKSQNLTINIVAEVRGPFTVHRIEKLAKNIDRVCSILDC